MKNVDGNIEIFKSNFRGLPNYLMWADGLVKNTMKPYILIKICNKYLMNKVDFFYGFSAVINTGK